jgi:hypothetical protein
MDDEVSAWLEGDTGTTSPMNSRGLLLLRDISRSQQSIAQTLQMGILLSVITQDRERRAFQAAFQGGTAPPQVQQGLQTGALVPTQRRIAGGDNLLLFLLLFCICPSMGAGGLSQGQGLGNPLMLILLLTLLND